MKNLLAPYPSSKSLTFFLILTWVMVLANFLAKYTCSYPLSVEAQVYAQKLLYNPMILFLMAGFLMLFLVASIGVLKQSRWSLFALILAVISYVLIPFSSSYYIQSTVDAVTHDITQVLLGFLLVLVFSHNKKSREPRRYYLPFIIAILIYFSVHYSGFLIGSITDPSLAASLRDVPSISFFGDISFIAWFKLFLIPILIYPLCFFSNFARYGFLAFSLADLLVNSSDAGTRWDSINSDVGVIAWGVVIGLIFSTPLVDKFRENKIQWKNIKWSLIISFAIAQSVGVYFITAFFSQFLLFTISSSPILALGLQFLLMTLGFAIETCIIKYRSGVHVFLTSLIAAPLLFFLFLLVSGNGIFAIDVFYSAIIGHSIGLLFLYIKSRLGSSLTRG